ncbi:hypothetical protein [Rhizobium leguminosarum]|uniref:hypothetical protein n=1 Tax=Rhizobium leguminosarum TaxID=384 RepID=UPI00103ECA4B|nr:hypothetical protein [Rhizobium leguminosarum]TBZ30763.1 hypothetical protein E0H44_35220 [Rhizobium leguminosarum bv. viciae]
MDVLSIILPAIGWEKDRAGKASDRRVEAYRLVSEVAADCLRTTNLLTTSWPSIERRISAALPDHPEVIKTCGDAVTKMLSETAQIQAMAEGYKQMIQKANTRVDWETGLMKLHEWRSTAQGIYPYAEATIKRFEDHLAEAAQLDLSDHTQKPVGFRDRDRGFNAPPL